MKLVWVAAWVLRVGASYEKVVEEFRGANAWTYINNKRKDWPKVENGARPWKEPCRLPASCNAENNYCASMISGMDVVVPSYPPDLCRLELLARSIARLDVCSLLRDVHVAWVTSESMERYEAEFQRTQAAIGPKHKIYFHESRTSALTRGWYEQQVIKIWAHTWVASEWYLCVDSKDIFVNPITLKSIFALHRLSSYRADVVPRKERYLVPASVLKIDIPDDAMLKPTLAPTIFNAQRVRRMIEMISSLGISFVDLIAQFRYTIPKPWLDQVSTKQTLTRDWGRVTEFGLYEVFSCCSPDQDFEKDPWRAQSIEEALRVPHISYTAWNFRGPDGQLQVQKVGNLASNRTLREKILIMGWHHGLRDAGSNISAPFLRALVSIYRQAHVIQDREEECNFYSQCATGLGVAC